MTKKLLSLLSFLKWKPSLADSISTETTKSDDEQITREKHSTAWNNLVMHADPSKFGGGDKRRAAAITSVYWNYANNGGLNYFLTYSFALDTDEVLVSLEALGATVAAEQLRTVLNTFDKPLEVSDQNARWDLLEDLWTDELDKFDILSDAAGQDLVNALTKHAEEYADYYCHVLNGE